jgi:hypothetical protein
MSDPRHFVLVIEDVDGEAEHGSWREYVIRHDSPRRTAKLICPAGVTEAAFATRVQLAVAALNGTEPPERPELPPCWHDYPPLEHGRFGSLETPEPHGITYKRVDGPDRAQAIADAWKMSAADPWVDFADAQTRRAEAAEQALAMLTAERDELARQLERTQALYFELEAAREADDESTDEFGDELGGDDVAVWEVATGTGTPTVIAGYITGDQRGLVALHFAQDDEPGWLDGQYNETLWVRRCKPEPEPEPGQAIRVVVSRVHERELVPIPALSITLPPVLDDDGEPEREP